jgi:hypothetical protein
MGDEKAIGPPASGRDPVDQVSVQPDGTPMALDRTWAWTTAPAGGARTNDAGPAVTTSATSAPANRLCEDPVRRPDATRSRVWSSPRVSIDTH